MLHLPNRGSVQANWAQNSGRLREQMSKGQPIYDSFRDATTGLQIPTKGSQVRNVILLSLVDGNIILQRAPITHHCREWSCKKDVYFRSTNVF